MITEGIASATSGTRDHPGALVRRAAMGLVARLLVALVAVRMAHAACASRKRSGPWKVMNSMRKVYSAVTNTPSSTHQ